MGPGIHPSLLETLPAPAADPRSSCAALAPQAAPPAAEVTLEAGSCFAGASQGWAAPPPRTETEQGEQLQPIESIIDPLTKEPPRSL